VRNVDSISSAVVVLVDAGAGNEANEASKEKVMVNPLKEEAWGVGMCQM